MADSASYAACEQRAATQRHRRWARANEHGVASKLRGGGATARRQKRKRSENVTRQAGQTACEMESRGPGVL